MSKKKDALMKAALLKLVEQQKAEGTGGSCSERWPLIQQIAFLRCQKSLCVIHRWQPLTRVERSSKQGL